MRILLRAIIAWSPASKRCTFAETWEIWERVWLFSVNLVPIAHVLFGQHQDTELWNYKFPQTKILGLPLSQRMRALVYMASRDNVDAFRKSIQNALKRLGKSKFGFEITVVSKFKSKRHVSSRFELVDYSRAPFLGADQKTRGLWERDWFSVCLKNWGIAGFQCHAIQNRSK